MIGPSQVYPRKTYKGCQHLNVVLQRRKLNSSYLEKAALEIAFMLSMVRVLFLVQTGPNFLPGKEYRCLTQLEKSMSIFISCSETNIFSLKENLAPVEALIESHLTPLQVQVH